MQNKKGFTLIELLIVVAVIGILASVVLVGLGPIQRQGRDARRISDLRQVQNGLELYYNKYGSYPSSLSLLVDPNTGVVANLPKDPSTGQDYIYTNSPTNSRYSYCSGADLEDLGNPNWKRSVNCMANCFDGALSGTPDASSLYCVGL